MKFSVSAGALFGVLGLALAASCSSPTYRYLPAENRVADGNLRSEAIYSVPPGAARGTVRVFAMGVVEIEPAKDARKVRALYLRLAISNQREGATWRLNTQDQFVAFPNDGQIRPIYAASDSRNLPELAVEPGDLKTLDLYFPLPLSQQSEKDLPAFDFHWQLNAGGQRIALVTPFDRVQVPDQPVVLYPYQPYPYAVGWGPAWWGPAYIYP